MELSVIMVQVPMVLLLPAAALKPTVVMLTATEDLAVLDSTVVCQIVCVVLYILFKLQQDILQMAELCCKLVQKTTTSLLTGPAKGICSTFTH